MSPIVSRSRAARTAAALICTAAALSASPAVASGGSGGGGGGGGGSTDTATTTTSGSTPCVQVNNLAPAADQSITTAGAWLSAAYTVSRCGGAWTALPP